MVYDSGMIVGRFQTFHKGHQSLVDTALKICDKVFILVGSAQESGTERNPFSIATRLDIIREIYSDNERVFIYSLPDLTNENDISPEWGKFLLSEIDKYLFKKPDLMIYGKDENRSRWFDPEDIENIAELIIPRAKVPISATMLREMMVRDDKESWMRWVSPCIHKMYDRLRSELLEVPLYAEMYEECQFLREQRHRLADEQL